MCEPVGPRCGSETAARRRSSATSHLPSGQARPSNRSAASATPCETPLEQLEQLLATSCPAPGTQSSDTCGSQAGADALQFRTAWDVHRAGRCEEHTGIPAVRQAVAPAPPACLVLSCLGFVHRVVFSMFCYAFRRSRWREC